MGYYHKNVSCRCVGDLTCLILLVFQNVNIVKERKFSCVIINELKQESTVEYALSRIKEVKNADMDNKEQLLEQYKMSVEEGLAYFNNEIKVDKLLEKKKVNLEKSDLEFITERLKTRHFNDCTLEIEEISKLISDILEHLKKTGWKESAAGIGLKFGYTTVLMRDLLDILV